MGQYRDDSLLSRAQVEGFITYVRKKDRLPKTFNIDLRTCQCRFRESGKDTHSLSSIYEYEPFMRIVAQEMCWVIDDVTPHHFVITQMN